MRHGTAGVPRAQHRQVCRRAGVAVIFMVAAGCAVIDDGGTRGGSAARPTVHAGGSEPEGLRGITAEHNRVRAAVGAGLPDLAWSDDLAQGAQAYADRLTSSCDLVHSGGPFGENLAWFGGQQATPAQVVDLWAAEGDCYTFGRFLESDGCGGACDACGHYTQLVWRDTRLVGCGVAACAGRGGEIWVCNYDPPGNFVGQEPY